MNQHKRNIPIFSLFVFRELLYSVSSVPLIVTLDFLKSSKLSFAEETFNNANANAGSQLLFECRKRFIDCHFLRHSSSPHCTALDQRESKLIVCVVHEKDNDAQTNVDISNYTNAVFLFVFFFFFWL